MKKTQYLHEYPFKKVIAITRMLEFLQEVFKAGPYQFEEVIEHCKMFRLKPGEIIIQKGEINNWIYFVLRGSCYVYLEKTDKVPINQITPGSMFGELSVILNERRTAFVKANPTKETILIGMDATIFDYGNDENVTSQQVCTLFYKGLRHVVFKRNRTLINQLEEKRQEPKHQPTLGKLPDYSNQEKQLKFYKDECLHLGKLVNELSQQLADAMKLEGLQNKVAKLMLPKLEEAKRLMNPLTLLNRKEDQQEETPYTTKKISELKFLIADQDIIFSDIIREYLTNLGAIQIKESQNGRKAWENICFHPNYDVIISEIDLPKLTGVSFIEKITTSGKRFGYPICIVVTDRKDNMIGVAAGAGAHGYVIKPFLEKELFKQLQFAFSFLKNIQLEGTGT